MLETTTHLFEYQINHVENLISALNKHNVIIDASDTGTGKTYSAMALCKEQKLDALIICPKSVIPTWFSVAETFGVNIYVSNYERIRSGRYFTKNYEVLDCPYIQPVLAIHKKERKIIIKRFI